MLVEVIQEIGLALVVVAGIVIVSRFVKPEEDVKF